MDSRLRGGRLFAGTTEGGLGGSGGDLRRATTRVAPTGEGERDGFPPSWGQVMRGNNGGSGGSPHPRGQRGEGMDSRIRGNNGGREGSPPPVFTGAGSRREDNEGKGNKIPRLRFAALGMTCGPGRRRGSLNSQTKCNSLLGCCHGKAI